MFCLYTIKANQVYLYVTKGIVSTVIIQWRIQDFPEVGRANRPGSGGGRQHMILLNFPKNCMKLKERGGGRASLAPP